ncbi:hypothetical protein HWV62_31279 [Athelia sp. TMB]|nr:hypothetical protein HWV62_31279 [Athelia sp. TMB]
MYAQNYGPQSPGLSNNPFLSDPSDAHQRFPDLTSSAQSSFNPNPQQSYGQQGQGYGPGTGYGGYNSTNPLASPTFGTAGGFGQQQQQFPIQSSPTGYVGSSQIQSYQTQPPVMNYQQTGFSGLPQQQQFSQQASFQQQGLHPNYQQYLQPGYGQAPIQQQQQQTGYQDVAQFDPYGPQSQQPHQQLQQPGPQQTQTSSSNPSHPREYIRTHKAELEKWDAYSWKQVLNTFDMLKDAWNVRKNDAYTRMAQVQQDYGFTGQQEVARLNAVQKDAESNAGAFSDPLGSEAI